MNKMDLIDALELAIQQLLNEGYNGLVVDKLEEQLEQARKL